MFRCPTCVSIVLDLDAARCPSCGTNLRRHRPIELGQSNRISTRMSAVEHAALESRSHATHTTGRAPSPGRDTLAFPEPIAAATQADVDLTRDDQSDIDLTVDEAARGDGAR